MTFLTHAEMTDRYGTVPPAIPPGKEYRWTISRAHADVTWMTMDGGATWHRRGVIWADERQRRDIEALEQQEIQRTLK